MMIDSRQDEDVSQTGEEGETREKEGGCKKRAIRVSIPTRVYPVYSSKSSENVVRLSRAGLVTVRIANE